MNENQIIGMLFGMGIFVIILIVALCIPVIIANWKLYKKAGKPGWASIVPFYSTWVLIEIAGLNWWYFLISILGSIEVSANNESFDLIITIGTYFINFLVYYNIAKKMKQNEVLYGILGAIVPFVPVLILGFSKSIEYDNSIEVSPNGIFGAPKTNNNNTNSNAQNQQPERYCLGCGQKLDNNVQFCTNCGKKVENPQNTQM